MASSSGPLSGVGGSKVKHDCHLCIDWRVAVVKVISVRACLCVRTCLSLCDCLGAEACVSADSAIQTHTAAPEHDCGTLTVHAAFGYA